MEISVFSSSPYVFPDSSFIFFIMVVNVSISYTLFLPDKIATVLSIPIPVSIHGLDSFSNFPSAVLLYCIKTSFQIQKRKITINQEDVELTYGESRSIVPIITDNNDDTLLDDVVLTYRRNDSDAAFVNDNGNIITKKAGTAIILVNVKTDGVVVLYTFLYNGFPSVHLPITCSSVE